jgi:uncharacterized protein
MARMVAFGRRHGVLAYLALTFAFSWGGILVVAGPEGLPLPVTSDPLEASPLLYIAMLIGPAVAGLIMTGVLHRRAGFHALGHRLLRWRIGARWFGLTLLTAPVLTTAVGILLAGWFHTPEYLPPAVSAGSWSAWLLPALGLGLVVGTFEELGWTGFATPEMRRRYGVFTTGLTLGLVWGAWHFLVFWEGDSFGGVFSLVLLVVKLFAFLVPYRVLMVWVHDRTQSLLLAILMHAALIVGLQPGIVEPTHVVVSNLLFATGLWGTIGALTASQRFLQRSARQAALGTG